MDTTFTLTATCPARSGIVAAVTTYLSDNGCYLTELHQFDDEDTGRFFLRTEGRVTDGSTRIENLEQGFTAVAERLDMEWAFHRTKEPMKAIISTGLRRRRSRGRSPRPGPRPAGPATG